MDLAKFLAERLDEDEAAATDFHDGRRCGCLGTWDREFELMYCDCGYPGRVLREVEAKRKILTDLDLSYPDEEHLLRLLAAIYEDHPDYDPAWKD
jgi:hypothetical protein